MFAGMMIHYIFAGIGKIYKVKKVNNVFLF